MSGRGLLNLGVRQLQAEETGALAPSCQRLGAKISTMGWQPMLRKTHQVVSVTLPYLGPGCTPHYSCRAMVVIR